VVRRRPRRPWSSRSGTTHHAQHLEHMLPLWTRTRTRATTRTPFASRPDSTTPSTIPAPRTRERSAQLAHDRLTALGLPADRVTEAQRLGPAHRNPRRGPRRPQRRAPGRRRPRAAPATTTPTPARSAVNTRTYRRRLPRRPAAVLTRLLALPQLYRIGSRPRRMGGPGMPPAPRAARAHRSAVNRRDCGGVLIGQLCRYGVRWRPWIKKKRIALFLDYENLAIGRERTRRHGLRLPPDRDALASGAGWSSGVRRLVVLRRGPSDADALARRADRVAQRLGASRKNAADIKMAVDAMELAFERGSSRRSRSCTGTATSPAGPQAARAQQARHRCRVEKSTSALLPPACDEFSTTTAGGSRGQRYGPGAPPGPTGGPEPHPVELEPEAPPVASGALPATQQPRGLVAQTVAVSGSAACGHRVHAQNAPAPQGIDLHRVDYGFLLWRAAAAPGRAHVVELADGPAKGDPEGPCPTRRPEDAFALAARRCPRCRRHGRASALSGLKNQLRRIRPDFSEKKLGYRSFLQFCQQPH